MAISGVGAHMLNNDEQSSARIALAWTSGITDGGLVLKYPKHEFHEVGFDARPENLPE